jgi:hypothetical protein
MINDVQNKNSKDIGTINNNMSYAKMYKSNR